MFKAPAIYFPSAVVLFDDDSLYAKLLIERLQMRNIHYLEHQNFILNQNSSDILSLNAPIAKDYLKRLKQDLNYFRDTSSLISVIISDLFMSHRNGIDFFESLSSPYVGRILISNFIDYKKTTEITHARNNGVLDIVLDKTKNLHEKLPKAIQAAKIKYFTAISNILFEGNTVDHPLSDTGFAKFFIDRISSLNPSEIIPNAALTRFTFKFDHGTPDISLHVINRSETKDLLLTDAAESAPAEVLKHISSGRYILCSEERDDVLPCGKLWPLYLRPAKQLNTGSNQFLYSFTGASYVESA